MSYMRSRWVSRDGRFAIEKRYHSYKAMALLPKNKEARARKEQETNLTQAKVNRKMREERLMLLCLDNFQSGDSYLTLTYREQPESAEEVRADFERWKRRVRTICRRHGVEMKYISVLENLSHGRPHGHVLLPELPKEAREAVVAAWPHGRVKVEVYQGALEDAKKLMAYFVKEDVDRETGSGRVMTSRNLVRRAPVKVRISRADTYREEIVPPKGYEVVQAFSYHAHTQEGFPLSVGFFERRAGLDDVTAWGGERGWSL